MIIMIVIIPIVATPVSILIDVRDQQYINAPSPYDSMTVVMF